jgi:hypothetical protein
VVVTLEMMKTLAATYALGGSVALATTNNYEAFIAMQGITLVVLVYMYSKRSMHGLATWIGLFSVSLLGRLLSLAITKASDNVNKAAKFRRWDALVTTLGYAVAMAYLMTSVIPGKSFSRYVGLTAIGIPSVTAAALTFVDTHEYDLGMYAAYSKIAYNAPTFVDHPTDTRVFIQDNIIAFAGTKSKENVLTDVKILDVPFGACGNSKTRVHAGFLEAWESVRTKVFQHVAQMTTDTSTDTVVFTGHSLGGALACLAGLDVACTLGKRVKVVSFGAPHVGDELFADAFNAKIWESTRVVNPLDPVPKSLSAQFAHVKGVYFVPPTKLNPHSLDAYKTAVDLSPGTKKAAVLLPLVFILAYVALRSGGRSRA